MKDNIFFTSKSQIGEKYVAHKMSNGGELKMGIKSEREHIGTAQKLYAHKLTPNQAPQSIAREHLKENPKYYTELQKMEQKFASGGTIDVANGTETVKVGDVVEIYVNSNPKIVDIVSITNKWINYLDPSDGKRKSIEPNSFVKKFIQFVSKKTPTGNTILTPAKKASPISTSTNKVTATGLTTIKKVAVKGTGGLKKILINIGGKEGNIVYTCYNPVYYYYINELDFIDSSAYVPNGYSELSFDELKNIVIPVDLSAIDPKKIVLSGTSSENVEMLKDIFKSILDTNDIYDWSYNDPESYFYINEKDKVQWAEASELDKLLSKGYSYLTLQEGYKLAKKPKAVSTATSTTEKASTADTNSLSKENEELLPLSSIPSTDISTWDAKYNIGDKVRLRVDFSRQDYFKPENIYTVLSYVVNSYAKRPENPSGRQYLLSDAQANWEGKDLELAKASTTIAKTQNGTKKEEFKQNKLVASINTIASLDKYLATLNNNPNDVSPMTVESIIIGSISSLVGKLPKLEEIKKLTPKLN